MSQLAPEDLKLIAAFIDRRLSEEERKTFLERVDADEALYEVFVETVRSREEMAQETAEGGEVVEHRTAVEKLPAVAALDGFAPRVWRSWMPPVSVAALLIIVLATPLLWQNLTEKSYAEMLVADGRLDEYLGEEWHEQEWSAMRGIRPGAVEADSAFRIGVQALDLEVALRTSEFKVAETLVGRIEKSLEGIAFSDHLQLEYASLGASIREEPRSRVLLKRAQSIEESTRASFPEFEAARQLGRWAEAGRLAARSGNREFFAPRHLRRAKNRFGPETWSQEVRDALSEIERLTAAPSIELDQKSLERAFADLINQS